MKRITIVAILLIGALAGIQQATAFTLKDYYSMESCNWVDIECKHAVRVMNYFMGKYPDKEAHMVDVTGATWQQITPEIILKKYALYHIDFYYGQRIPVGQEIYYCESCDIQTALKIQEDTHNEVRIWITPLF